MTKTSVIDLFCGIGGLSYGLKQAGLSIKAGIDSDLTCEYAYKRNIEATFLGSNIKDVDGHKLREDNWSTSSSIKILVGCAPCQPFSTHSNKNQEKHKSEKWGLLDDFIRLVKETKPTIVSMENVPNISNQDIFRSFVQKLESLEYKVMYKNVYCPDYGIPQKRRRLVLLASQLGEIDLIAKTHEPKNYVTVKDAIGHLPNINPKDKVGNDPLDLTIRLSEINLKRIRASKPNGTWADWPESLRLECHKKESGSSYKAVYGRMSWDEPSPTITTQFYNYGTGRFGHPEQDRSLTIREAAILQTFPPDFEFSASSEGISLTRTGTHIGNAVPVKLGYIIGLSIIDHLNKNQNGNL